MNSALLISVRLHEGWYHGAGDTPSPARLFQALIAGAGLSGPLSDQAVTALKWLEEQLPPAMAAPTVTRGQAVINYVPNNDLDAKQGDHRRIGEIRTKKAIRPLLFDARIPFLFAWLFDQGTDAKYAQAICDLADRLYQFGRTVDMAWACGEVISSDELENRLRSYEGTVRRPVMTAGDVECPAPGSLNSLHRRYDEASQRFAPSQDNNGQTFRRRSKPRWRRVSYDNAVHRFCLELRDVESDTPARWPLEQATMLVESVRDGAAERLRRGLGNRIQEIDSVLIGRRPSGANAGLTEARVRIYALPSIGHSQADMLIRRVLVQIPGECALRFDDVAWAFSGLRVQDPLTRDAIDVLPTNDVGQLKHYGINSSPERIWRTVTPAALPDAPRHRIAPQRKQVEAKAAKERQVEHSRAIAAVRQALRHAQVHQRVLSVRVQREPFDLRGSRVEEFANGTRFSKHGLWHVEVEFESPVSGPLVIGNGRFLGLGLMRPVHQTPGLFVYSIESGLEATVEPTHLARSLRRAVMARIQAEFGSHTLPSYFTGHDRKGLPAESEREPHLSFIFDPDAARLAVLAPHLIDHRPLAMREEEYLRLLSYSLCTFRELRAGRAGYLRLTPLSMNVDSDYLFGASRIWRSVTPYVVTRHAKRLTATDVLRNDVITECERRGLPRPDVCVDEWHAIPGQGLCGQLQLTFKHHVVGPVSLGRTRHLGGGLFRMSSDRE